MNAFQLMAAKMATAPSTTMINNVRKYIQTSLHGPASLRSAGSKTPCVCYHFLHNHTEHVLSKNDWAVPSFRCLVEPTAAHIAPQRLSESTPLLFAQALFIDS